MLISSINLIKVKINKIGSILVNPNVYASHSYEAGVHGDNIPDNTHIDLSQLSLPSTGAFPLYDSSLYFGYIKSCLPSSSSLGPW